MKAKVIKDIQSRTTGEVLNQVLNSNETYSFQNGNEKHSISTLSGSDSNLKKAGVTSINFGSNCQQILKGNNDNQEIILYDVEHHIEGFNTPIIEYALFDEDGQKLDLDECNDDRVIYYIPNNINEGDLDKHDPTSDFYNNCNKGTAEEGVDMTSYDKSLYFNDNNMSLCQKGCIMKGLHPETKKTICDCSISSNIEFNDANQADFLDKMESDKSTSNFGVTNCFGDVFSSPKKLITNSGFIILTIILGIYIIIFIIFCSKGKRNLEKKIDEVIYNKFDKEEKKKEKKEKKKKIKHKIKDDNAKIEGCSDGLDQVMGNGMVKKLKKRKKRNSKLSNAHKKNSITGKSSKNYFVNVIPGEKNNLNLINNNFDMSVKYKLTTNINNNNAQIEDKPNHENDYEMNNLDYIHALKYDDRPCCDYYCSLLKNKQLFLFTFCSFNDYNSGIVKKFIFFLSFAIHYTISALFFNDDNMHQIYEDKGKYNISYQMPKIIISAVSSNVFLRIMLETLILTDRNVLQVKRQFTRQLAENEKEKVLKCINIKFAIFFILNFVLLVLFWFYLVSFSGTYENTQIHLIENTFIGFAFSLLYPFFWNIIPSALRMCALGTKKPERRCLYIASKICQLV